MHGFVAAESFWDIRRFAVRKLRIERQECALIPAVRRIGGLPESGRRWQSQEVNDPCQPFATAHAAVVAEAKIRCRT